MRVFLRNILYFTVIISSLIGLSCIFNKAIIDFNQLLTFKGNRLFVGASRGECAVIDDIIDNSLNASYSADALYFSFIKIKEFKRANKNLDTLILTLNHRTIDENVIEHFNRAIILEEKLPKYYHLLDWDDLSYMMKLNSSSVTKSLFIQPQYSLRLMKRIIFNPVKKSEIIDIGRYKQLDHFISLDNLDYEISQYNSEVYEISPKEVSVLRDIVKFCDSRKITLIFLNPPVHHALYNSNEYKIKKSIFDDFFYENFNGYTYLDYSGESLKDSCFADLIHLNYKGAHLFSKLLSEKLNSTGPLKTSDSKLTKIHSIQE